jgi:hypothetical protein
VYYPRRLGTDQEHIPATKRIKTGAADKRSGSRRNRIMPEGIEFML